MERQEKIWEQEGALAMSTMHNLDEVKQFCAFNWTFGDNRAKQPSNA